LSQVAIRNIRSLRSIDWERKLLFGLIMQHISQENKDAIKEAPNYLTWYPNKDPEK
jgi:hypothetical protein